MRQLTYYKFPHFYFVSAVSCALAYFILAWLVKLEHGPKNLFQTLLRKTSKQWCKCLGGIWAAQCSLIRDSTRIHVAGNSFLN